MSPTATSQERKDDRKSRRDSAPRPLVWALTGARAGDNAQVRALSARIAEETGARVIEKRLSYNFLRILPNFLLPAGLAMLDRKSRSLLSGPPWPDLVIGVGRRSVPVALQIRKLSSGRTRLVWLGRPRAALERFDLVLTTAQYGLPACPNVILLDLPPALPAASGKQLESWRKRLSELPHPRVAVMVGGARGELLFDARIAGDLGRAVNALCRRKGAAWIVSTSPRTGARQARALHEVLEKPGYFYYWRESGTNNPHHALPALADLFIVTSDSASMIAEAVRSGKPVCLFRLPRRWPALRWKAQGGIMRWLAERGVLSPPRDMEAFCSRLVERGYAAWLDEERCGEQWGDSASALRERELEAALVRIKDMLVS